MRVGFPGFLRRDKLLMGLVLQRSEISPKKKIVDCATCGVSRLLRFVSLLYQQAIVSQRWDETASAS